MRVLLDEDLNTRLRHALSDQHRVETVEYQGWKGLMKLAPEIERILPSLRPGDVHRIHPPEAHDPPGSGEPDL